MRDVLRCCELLESTRSSVNWDAASAVEMLYYFRLRTPEDRAALCERYLQVFGRPLCVDQHPALHVREEFIQIGSAMLPRTSVAADIGADSPSILPSLLQPLQHVITVRCN